MRFSVFGFRRAYFVLMALAVLSPQEARAQSFLGALFGLGEQPAPPPVARTSPRPPQPTHEREFVPQSQSEPQASPGVQVQTMCVRTCDGYYWPLHYPVARGDVGNDEALCRSTCDSATKLYTRADPGTEPEEMVDSEGISYGASATAFLYRKRLIDGCSCRPMPWSEGERARHEGYALALQEKKLRVEQVEAERVAAASRPAEALATTAVAEAALEADGPRLGPQEAALLAARRDGTEQIIQPAGEHGPVAMPLTMTDAKPVQRARVRDAGGAAHAERGVRRPRMAQSGGGTFGWLAGPSKFTYPGDPPGR